jgi:hypothetical protein
MSQDLELLLDFVSGNIDAESFESKLYASSTIEEFLSNDPDLPPYSYIDGDNYLFLISQDYSDLGGVINAQGAVEQFLERKHVPFMKTEKHNKLFDLILEAQPEWLDIDSKYIAERYISDIEGLNKKDALKMLKEKLLSDFTFIKRAPKWIQSPAWPIVDKVPLVFLGQIDIDNYFHDTAAAYLFYDPKNGSSETIIQIS